MADIRMAIRMQDTASGSPLILRPVSEMNFLRRPVMDRHVIKKSALLSVAVEYRSARTP